MAISIAMTTSWRERLQQALDEAGLTPAEILRRAELPPTFWHDIIKRNVTPSVDRLASLANALGLTLDEVYSGSDTEHLKLKISGACIGTGDMWEPVDARGARAVPFRILGDDMVAITVDTPDLEPDYRRGDVLCGRRTIGLNLDNLIGRDCIVVTKDGERYIKTLTRGIKPNRFTLRSIRRHVPDLVDVKLDWAAPISMILRGD